jgi:hypothetical protein
MEQDEKPLNNKFWTSDMILLAILNVVLVGGIIFGLTLLFMTFSVPVTTWLNGFLGL